MITGFTSPLNYLNLWRKATTAILFCKHGRKKVGLNILNRSLTEKNKELHKENEMLKYLLRNWLWAAMCVGVIGYILGSAVVLYGEGLIREMMSCL